MKESEKYINFFSEEGKPSGQEQMHFLVTIDDFEPLFGDPMAVAENVAPSMDGLFFNRKGSQLGLRVLSNADKGVAAVVWIDGKKHECCPVLMTNGRAIITSDPCFIPTSRDGLCIDINERYADLTEFSGSEFSWLVDTQRLIKRKFSQDFTVNYGIRVEEMRKRLERKISWAPVKGRRGNF